MINNGDNLHVVRGRRNDTAHEISATVTWDELEADSFEIEVALQNLNLVGNRPEFHIIAEPSALQGSGDSRIAFNCDYSVKVKEEEKVAAEWKWRRSTYNDSSA